MKLAQKKVKQNSEKRSVIWPIGTRAMVTGEYLLCCGVRAQRRSTRNECIVFGKQKGCN